MRCVSIVSLLCLVWETALAIEVAQYKFLGYVTDSVELREYKHITVATTIVDGDIRDSGNTGFRRLASYIFGDNLSQQKIEMTAPVWQQKLSRDAYQITFFLPKHLNLPPLPSNQKVSIREIDITVAALEYRGGWKVDRFYEHLSILENVIKESKWKIKGEAIWARYDPPWMPSFLRRNEVLIPVVD